MDLLICFITLAVTVAFVCVSLHVSLNFSLNQVCGIITQCHYHCNQKMIQIQQPFCHSGGWLPVWHPILTLLWGQGTFSTKPLAIFPISGKTRNKVSDLTLLLLTTEHLLYRDMCLLSRQE